MRTTVAVVCGAVLGAGLVLPVAYGIAMQHAVEELAGYAGRVLRVSERGAAETRHAMITVRDDRLPFCSDDELALMRRLIYDSYFVRDLGRSRDGLIYCTSSRGRFVKPIQVVEPELLGRMGASDVMFGVSPDQGVAIAPGLTGIIIDIPGVTAVINQGMMAGLDDAHMRSAGLVYDRDHGKTIRVFGDTGALRSAEVVAQKRVERDGMVYVPVCSDRYSVCAVAAESRAEMVGQRKNEIGLDVGAGGLIGVLLALIGVLAWERMQSFERHLSRAVHEGRIRCVYQPIVDLDTGAILGAETLARWTNEAGEAVPPDVFIAVAEETGLIGEITRMVIGRVIDELGPILYEPGFMVTVNISSSDLVDPEFPARVREAMAWTGIEPRAIGFELTEHSTVDRREARQAIARLQAAGHGVYLDDFGTGYSSLAYLQELHVDAIKIDRAFTSTVGTGAVTASVVPQILEMASRLGLTVVVEGIEKPEQAEYFRGSRSGIRGQGWLYGRPVPANEFLRMMAMRLKPAPKLEEEMAGAEGGIEFEKLGEELAG